MTSASDQIRYQFENELSLLCWEQPLFDGSIQDRINSVCEPISVPFSLYSSWYTDGYIKRFFDPVFDDGNFILKSKDLFYWLVFCDFCKNFDLFKRIAAEPLLIDDQIYRCNNCRFLFYFCEKCDNHGLTFKRMQHYCPDCYKYIFDEWTNFACAVEE